RVQSFVEEGSKMSLDSRLDKLAAALAARQPPQREIVRRIIDGVDDSKELLGRMVANGESRRDHDPDGRLRGPPGFYEELDGFLNDGMHVAPSRPRAEPLPPLCFSENGFEEQIPGVYAHNMPLSLDAGKAVVFPVTSKDGTPLE